MLAAWVPKLASSEAEEFTSRADWPPTQESMCVGGVVSTPVQTTVPSTKMLNNALFEAGQMRSIAAIVIVAPELFVITHFAMLLVREKLPTAMSVQTSCVGVGVRVGVKVRVAVGVAVRVGVAEGVAVRVGVWVALGEGVELAEGRTLVVPVTAAVGVREAVGVLVVVLNAAAVSVSAVVASSVPSSAGGRTGLSDPLDSISRTCSVAAIAVWICSSDMLEPAANATAVESESTVAFQSTVGLGVCVAVPPTAAAPRLTERLISHREGRRISAPRIRIGTTFRFFGEASIIVLSSESSSSGLYS